MRLGVHDLPANVQRAEEQRRGAAPKSSAESETAMDATPVLPPEYVSVRLLTRPDICTAPASPEKVPAMPSTTVQADDQTHWLDRGVLAAALVAGASHEA
jgi:hypothetical protein